jgi:hypothetical protein
VTFKDGSAIIATTPLNPSGQASTATTLPVGTHALIAVYNGDALDANSSSASVSQPILTDTAANLSTETTDMVESSAKYLALPTLQQKLVNATLAIATAALAKIAPHMTPAQLALYAKAYDAAVTTLQSQGWLTSAQAATLQALAGELQT